jgi:hypothetical protein
VIDLQEMPKKRDLFGLSWEQDESSQSSQMRDFNLFKEPKEPFAFDFTTAIASETVCLIDEQATTSADDATTTGSKEAAMGAEEPTGWSRNRFDDVLLNFSRSKDSDRTTEL